MLETAQQYTTRIRSYLGSQDALTVLAATPQLLRTKLQGLPDNLLRTRPEPNRWSIIEQVAHLSDVEIVLGFRVRFIVGSDNGVSVPAYDQDRWQQEFNYVSRSLPDTLNAFEAARKNNLALYRSLTNAQWEKYCIHSERGKESARDVVSLAAGHDLNHLQHVDRILKANASAAAS